METYYSKEDIYIKQPSIPRQIIINVYEVITQNNTNV